MDISSLIGAAVVVWALLIPFTSFCAVDSDRPTVSATWKDFLSRQAMLTCSATAAYSAYSTQSKYTLVLTMLCVGMLVGAAAIDPTQVDRERNESWTSFGLRFLAEQFRRLVVSKLVVYVAAAIATYTFPHYWYLALYFVVLHLHFYKMANCIAVEARTERPKDAPVEIRRKWAWRAVPAAIALGILLKGATFVFGDLNYVPEKWGAFGGFSLMSAAIFVVRMLTRSAD